MMTDDKMTKRKKVDKSKRRENQGGWDRESDCTLAILIERAESERGMLDVYRGREAQDENGGNGSLNS